MVKSDDTPLAGQLRQAATLASQHIDQILRQHGIARSQYRALWHLAHHDQLSQKELAELMHVRAATVTPLVEILERKGLVVRQQSDLDRRSNSLALTKAGRQRYQAIPEPAAIVERQLAEILGRAELARLKQQLDLITQTLTDNL